MPQFNTPPPPGGAQSIASTLEESKLLTRTLDTLRRLRYFRLQYDAKRAYFYKQYVSSRDRRMFPDNLTPRSNSFVPFPHRNVETVTAHTVDAFFSIDPPFETRVHGVEGEGNSDAMQWVLLTCLKRAKWKAAIEQHIRNICIYGFGGLSVDWDFDYEVVDGPEPIYAMMPQMDPQTGKPLIGPDGNVALSNQPVVGPDGQPVQIGVKHVTKRVPRNCPKLTPIDIYDLMVDPDGGQVARMMEKTVGQLMREAQSNPQLYFPDNLQKLINNVKQLYPDDFSNILIRMAELWDSASNTVTLITFGEDAEAVTWKNVRYSYRGANYSSYKRKVYAGSPVILYTGPNAFAHKRCSILYTSYTKLPNEVYGIGVIEKSSNLVDSFNNFTNMIADNWNIGINRRYAYDTQADIDHDALDQANVPGGKVGGTGDPNRFIAPLPTFTPQAGDYQVLDLYKSMIDMVTGVSDLTANAQTPVGNNNLAAAESSYLFRMFIRNYEDDILQPMLEMVASMIQQFGTDEMEYEITDAPPQIAKYGRVKLETLLGSYDYDFVGANYASDKIVRQRNLMAYYNLASQSPYANQGEFLREIGKSLAVPHVSRLLRSDAEVQQATMSQQQQAAQMEVLKKLLDTASKSTIAQVRNDKSLEAARRGKTAQDEIERIIQEDVFQRLGLEDAPHPPQQADRGGRPPKTQHEGKLPGANSRTVARTIAQEQGLNGIGLEGLGANEVSE